MKYLVLMTETDPAAWDRATDEQREQVFDRHRAFDAAVRKRGTMLAGEALEGVETASTLRPSPDGQLVTDGPYAETAEQLGGFYLIDVADMDAAIELARLLPASYTTEIRPVIRIEEDDDD